MAYVRLSRQGTIALIHAFQSKAGLKGDQPRGLQTIMTLNDTFVRDAESGMAYCMKEGEGRLSLPALYDAHLDRAADMQGASRSWKEQLVDDVVLDHIKSYLVKEGVAVKGNSDLVTAAVSLATVFYEHYGTGREGSLHIPTINPGNLLQVRYTHIYLKL